jgi:polyhydroxyalkanoate synthesis regulator phasin
MVMDALRGYVQLASGLTEVTKQRAEAAAKALLQQTGADKLTSGLTTKVSDLADEIVATSKSNRQLLQAIVTNEVEGAVSRLGFVRAEEVAALTRRVQTLESELAEARAAGRRAEGTSPVEPAGDVMAEDGPGPVPVAAKSAVKKSAARSAVKKSAAPTGAAKQAATKKAPAKGAAPGAASGAVKGAAPDAVKGAAKGPVKGAAKKTAKKA